MTITATTLSAALGSSDVLAYVASATGITAPNNQTGSGITVLYIEQEQLLVIGVNGTQISVLRGQAGTVAAAHASGAQVQIGLMTDFPAFIQTFGNLQTSVQQMGSRKQNAIFLTGSADAVDPSVPAYYVVKTAGVDAMTLATPTAPMEGNIIDIWSDTANAHTITAATTLFCVGASALKTVCTFPAYRGSGVTLRVCNAAYHVLGSGGTGTNGGPVVWT